MCNVCGIEWSNARDGNSNSYTATVCYHSHCPLYVSCRLTAKEVKWSTDIGISCHPHSNRYGGELENSVSYDIYQNDITAVRGLDIQNVYGSISMVLSR